MEEAAGPVDVIESLRTGLARVYHDTNNPLAIVSGNAQYLLEIAKAMELGDDLMQPMRDIEEASERVAQGLKEIVRLREQIEEYLRRLNSGGTS